MQSFKCNRFELYTSKLRLVTVGLVWNTYIAGGHKIVSFACRSTSRLLPACIVGSCKNPFRVEWRDSIIHLGSIPAQSTARHGVHVVAAQLHLLLQRLKTDPAGGVNW